MTLASRPSWLCSTRTVPPETVSTPSAWMPSSATEIVTAPSRIEMSASELTPSAPVEVSRAAPDSTVTESLPRRAVPAEVTFRVRFLRLRSSFVLIPLA